MVQVSNADRVVFPEVRRTKGDLVSYYEQIAPRLLPHVIGRPLSIRRYPKGLAEPGFFQKNVPAHYPESIGRFTVPRSVAASKKHRRRGAGSPHVTVYPVVKEAEHLAYLANQGAIELHVPTSRGTGGFRPDRIVTAGLAGSRFRQYRRDPGPCCDPERMFTLESFFSLRSDERRIARLEVLSSPCGEGTKAAAALSRRAAVRKVLRSHPTLQSKLSASPRKDAASISEPPASPRSTLVPAGGHMDTGDPGDCGTLRRRR